MRRSALRLLVLAAWLPCGALLLGGCDMLGIESSEKVAAARDADGRAVGGACRHAARAIEDCYALNKKADKAAIFAGWRDMNDYMRENKIDPVPSQLASAKPRPPAGDDAAPDEKSDKGSELAEKDAKAEKPDKAEAKPPADAREGDGKPKALAEARGGKEARPE